ncbi:MAG: DUF1775 domain-containing protein [Solirubrobacteraceae bacterium]|nr:DUF1775 domain-containing protein [Solirubrobacteraceae bacterium]
MTGRAHRTPVALLALALVATALPAGPAAAHVQVRPVQAAPADPVLWTVLVPSEQESGTRQVELAVPQGVLPFSFEDPPGWTRTLRTSADGSVRSIVWRGRTAADGLATFRFLASTPERAGPIAWKALQTYRDGTLVRWIGAPGSEHPASVTTISSSAARENAGGEGDETTVVGDDDATAASGDVRSDGREPDWIARGLGLLALLASGLAVIRLRRAA